MPDEDLRYMALFISTKDEGMLLCEIKKKKKSNNSFCFLVNIHFVLYMFTICCNIILFFVGFVTFFYN